jgi:hypothetical protein
LRNESTRVNDQSAKLHSKSGESLTKAHKAITVKKPEDILDDNDRWPTAFLELSTHDPPKRPERTATIRRKATLPTGERKILTRK